MLPHQGINFIPQITKLHGSVITYNKKNGGKSNRKTPSSGCRLPNNCVFPNVAIVEGHTGLYLKPARLPFALMSAYCRLLKKICALSGILATTSTKALFLLPVQNWQVHWHFGHPYFVNTAMNRILLTLFVAAFFLFGSAADVSAQNKQSKTSSARAAYGMAPEKTRATKKKKRKDQPKKRNRRGKKDGNYREGYRSGLPL